MIKLIHKFTDKKIVDLNKVIKIDNYFYLVNDKLRNICSKIKKKAEYIGIYLGTKDKPSLYLLDLLAKNSKKKVWVNKKGEWLFICKRDIFANSIKDMSCKLNDFVLVMNQHDECIGYGQMVANLSSKKTVVKRMFDIGDFLRRERS